MLFKANTMLFAIELIFVRHSQFLWCNEVESRVKMAHSHDKRMYSTPILQVSNEVDIEVFKRSLRLIDGV